MSVLYAITDTVFFRSNSLKISKAALRKFVPVLFAALAVQVSVAQVAQKPGGSSNGIYHQVYQNSQGGYSYRILNGENVVVTEDFNRISEVDASNKAEAERLAIQALNIYKSNASLTAEQVLAERQFQANKERTLTRSSNGINQNTLAVCTFTGTLQTGDQQVSGRIFRDAIASTCAAPKVCPGPFAGGPFWYDVHTVTNPTSSPVCVTVSGVSSNGQQVHITAYTTFNPSNICTNYIADQGSSSIATPVQFSFNIPAGATIELVIYNPINGATTTPYTINVDNCPTLPCQPIVITGQPADVTACELTNATFSVTAGPTGISYNWQEDRGTGFVYLTNGGQYSGVNSPTLTVSNLTAANNGWRYRAVITCTGGGLPQISDDALLTVLPAPAQPTVVPATSQICPGGVQQLSVFSSPTSFSNTGTNTIPGGAPATSSGPASTYPSTIVASGLPVNAIVQSVTINGLTHTFPGDIDMVLRSPTGQNVIFFSDAGGGTDVSGINITFNDNAAAVLPASLVSGTFRPTNVGATDAFVAPGPGSVTNATPQLSSFTGDPNGTWELWIVDDAGGDVGQITGWSLTFAAPGTAIFSPLAGLFLDAGLTTPYTGTAVSTVYASPAATTTYTVNVNNGSCNSATATATVTVNQPPNITAQPSTNGNVCVGDNKVFTVAATGTNLTYQWQVDAGSGFVNIANAPPYTGATTNTLTITGAPASFNGFIYRVVVSGTCPPAMNSTTVTLVVNPLPTVSVTPQNQCSPVALTATGADTYTWSPAAGLSATTGATVTASPSTSTIYTVTGTITATGCTNVASANVLGTPTAPTLTMTPTNGTICLGGSAILGVSPTQSFTNAAAITIPSVGSATPYPSTINVSGLATSGVSVASVTLTNFSHTWPDDVDIVLQSPTGVNVILMSDAGGSTAVTGRTWTFSDAAAAAMADGATNLSGTYRPTNYGTPDNFAPPGPGSLTQATPSIATFGTGNHNGTWRLFVVDAFAGDLGTIANGWTITFNTGAAPVVFSPTTGLFTDAGLTTPYTGTPVTQVYASPAATTTYTANGVNTSSTATFRAKGPVQVPGIGTGGTTSIGTAYPSTTSVSGIPTTATVRSVTLTGLTHTWSDDIDIVLQSPTGVNVILMSDAGGGNAISGVTYTFEDAAANSLADGTVNVSGTYKPSNYLTPDNFPAPGPGSLTQPTNPLLSSFTGNPNGTWNLYVVDDASGDIGVLTGWSITFNTNTVSCTGPSATATVTVHLPITITQHPQNRTACAGDNVTFTATATGTVQSYQWQVSTNGGVTWTNVGAASPTGNTLTLTGVTTAMNNNRYRVVVSSAGCGPTNSNAAILTVNPLPTVSLTASPYTQLRPGMVTTLTVTSTPAAASWQWFNNGVAVPSITTGSAQIDAFNLGNYSVTVTDVNGCRNTTNTVSLTALPSNNLFIFPNPAAGGQFTVTYYTPTVGSEVTINVIDMKGRRLESRVGTTTAAYTRFDFSTLKLGVGVYVIEFRNSSGDRLAAGRVVVIR